MKNPLVHSPTENPALWETDRSPLEVLEREAHYQHIAKAPDARFQQLWDYEAARDDACRFEAVRISGGGLAMVRLKTIPVFGRGIAYCSFGPLLPKPESGVDVAGQVLAGLEEEYTHKRRLILRIAPPLVLARNTVVREALAARGFRRVPGVADYRTILVSLDDDLDSIKAGFKKRLRYGVNRGLRNQFAIEEGTSIELYDRFLALYAEMRKRKKFDTGVDPQWVRKVQGLLPSQYKLRIRVARLGDEDMAATAHAFVGDTATYLLGATRVETNQDPARSYAAHAIHWDVIRTAKQDGLRWYDLGGIDPDKNPGGYTFKEAFGGIDASSLGAWEIGSDLGSRTIVRFGEHLRNLRRRSLRQHSSNQPNAKGERAL